MYGVFKIIHLLALVLWLGPAIGAYWILLRMGAQLSPQQRLRMEQAYEFVLRVEHIAFLVLLGSGLGLIQQIGMAYLNVQWMQTKLILVGGIIIVECFDVFFSHILFRRMARRGEAISSSVWIRFTRQRNVFYVVSVPILFGLVLGIFYLVIFKP